MPSYKALPLVIRGLLLLLLGWTVYGLFRTSDYPWIFQFPAPANVRSLLPLWFQGSAASLFHVWAFALLTAAAAPVLCRRHPWLAPALWLMINLLFEFGQSKHEAFQLLARLPEPLGTYFSRGRFDSFDILAIVLGASLAWLTLRHAALTRIPSQPLPKRQLPSATVLLLGCLGILASTSARQNSLDPPIYAKPIYMSYEELRNSFAVLPARPIQNPGKIFIKGSFLFISDILRGVHIVDNSNPAAPKPIGFLKIPGNQDIAVKDQVLYADSFVDLVAIDLSDAAEPRLVERIQDIFPWEPESWYGDMPYYALGELDQSKGVPIFGDLQKSDF